jgi:hypothetical protein
MTPYREQVEAALRVVAILSPTRFAWFGQASPPLPRKTLRALDAAAARAHLVSELQRSLYLGFYATGTPVRDAAPKPRPARCPDLVDALSRANAGTGCWSTGWLVRSVEAAGIVCERDDLRLMARTDGWRAPAGGEARVGEVVHLLTPKEQLGVSPGCYLAQSNLELGAERDAAIVRVYWNTTAAGALMLMAHLTSLLNDQGLSFRLKVVAHPDAFTRCDAAVLYLLQNDFEAAAPALERAFAAVAGELGPAVPAFTKPLAPGVGLAEDPAQGTSFGWHRCGLVAEALVDAHRRGIDALERRLAGARAHFAAAGLSFEAPYLNAGSHDRYDLFRRAPEPRGARPETRSGQRASTDPPATSSTTPLTQLALSEARYSAASATSSGVPRRRIG